MGLLAGQVSWLSLQLCHSSPVVRGTGLCFAATGAGTIAQTCAGHQSWVASALWLIGHIATADASWNGGGCCMLLALSSSAPS
jgi:hypothetical protein